MSTTAPVIPADSVAPEAPASSHSPEVETRPSPSPRPAPPTGRVLRGALTALPSAAVALLAILAVVAQLTGHPVRDELLWVLAILAAVVITTRGARQHLAEALVPPRTVVVCPADEVSRHEGEGRGRVRGFTPEVLVDSDLVVRAVRLDVGRLGADRVELHAGIPDDTLRTLSWELRRDGVDLLIHQSAGNVRPTRTRLTSTDLGPGILLAPPRPSLPARVLKRAMDVVGSALLLLLVSPVLLVTAALIRLEDRGPALYRQERIGLDGEPFRIFKFRSMAVDADARLAELLAQQDSGDTPLFKVQDDPRLTKLGPFLRRSSLDELPQLLNVLLGTMSLVGPRPQRAEEVALYDGHAPHRLGVRPGMTGLWQVSGRSRLSWDEARELDVYYAHNWTPWMDVVILLRTVRAVATSDGAY